MTLRPTAPLLLALFLLLPSATLAAAPAARVVPGDEVSLAAVDLVGEGRQRPVLLFDARDPEALQHYTRGKKMIECLHGPATPVTVAKALEAATGAPCRAVASAAALAHELWPAPHTAIVTGSDDYPWLLRAAAFAGATDGALLPLATGDSVPPDWKLDVAYVTPSAEHAAQALAAIAARVVAISEPDQLTAELRRQRGIDPPTAVVVANPADRNGLFSPSSLSLLAPLLAAHHRAPLFLTSTAAADDVEREVTQWIDRNGLKPTHVVLVGDELALRSHRVPDPVLAAGGPEALGGGTEVRVELFSEIQNQRPQDYAVGRIVGEDLARTSAMLARLLHEKRSKQPAIFLSNADEQFALGETISRATVNELKNVGTSVKAYFGSAVTPAVIQKALASTDLLVWEGHARDLALEERGDVSIENAPAAVVLQGCYTLDRSDPFILMERGTDAIIATSAAIYSASGSAFAHALFDGLLYDDLDLGTAVRDARNYLLALTVLKRERGHVDWTKTYRAALAFALWGDPSDRSPVQPSRPSVPPVGWQLDDGRLGLTIPRRRLPPVAVGRYRSAPPARGMLGGLILVEGAEEGA